MTFTPLYADNGAPRARPNGSHTGLWYTRFFNGFTADWDVEDKKAWIEHVAGPCGDARALQTACRRQMELVRSMDGKCQTFSNRWHFVTGLGLPHPVENGFTWHPTLGVPYLCGASVKGLVRAWLETMADLPEDKRQERLEDWFGTQERSGQLVFFDAIPVRQPRLAADVMTPHMDKWYEQGDTVTDPWRNTKEALGRVPGDWHDPVPVPFLVVEEATFLFSISPRAAEFAGQVELVVDSLESALRVLGVGAKTAVGYGHMEADPDSLARVESRLAEIHEAQIRAQELQAMSPFERSLEETIASTTDLPPHVTLLHALEKGRWEGDEARQVLEKIRHIMMAENKWRPTSRKPKKDKDHQRTLKVISLLEGTN